MLEASRLSTSARAAQENGQLNGPHPAMSLAGVQRRQFQWRDWPTILGALPPLAGQTVLDLGCGVGDLAAELTARGAYVIGFDMNEELLREARSRGLVNAEFRRANLALSMALDIRADGLWSSFTAAYFPDFSRILRSWATALRPGGWAALTEIDDLFGHEPLSAGIKSMLDAYARDSLEAGRYDFDMGHKLADHLHRAGFTAVRTLNVVDQELAFDGPAPPDVIDAWRNRFDRMTLLRDFCGADFERVRGAFLDCLVRADHRSTASVVLSIGRKDRAAA